jgi:hypothetical protein
MKDDENLLVRQIDHIAIVARRVDVRRREALTRLVELGGIERGEGEDQERRAEQSGMRE